MNSSGKKFVDLQLKKIEEHLKKYMNSSENKIDEAVKYTLFAPCKRIRPLIMISFYELCGGKSDEIYKFACALEMIHTYSLIHDDLPCMDNDSLRRGKKCSHLEFGESTALLAGDALLTKAFEIASTGNFLNYEKAVKCINTLAYFAGPEGMILGQYKDLNSKYLNENIIDVHRLKTSCLFVAAAKIGALLAGAEEKDISLAFKFGLNYGIAFQLIDDILDEDLNLSENVNGIKVKDLINKIFDKEKEILKKFKGDISPLEYLLDFVYSKIN